MSLRLGFHDALIVKQSEIIREGVILPTTLKTSKHPESHFLSNLKLPANKEVYYRIDYYNDPNLKYDGEITNEVHYAEESLDRTTAIRLLAS